MVDINTGKSKHKGEGVCFFTPRIGVGSSFFLGGFHFVVPFCVWGRGGGPLSERTCFGAFPYSETTP